MTANDPAKAKAISDRLTAQGIGGNGSHPFTGIDEDIPLPPEPEDDTRDRRQPPADDEPTTWEPVDLGPYLRGEIEQSQPSLGMARSDGLRLIYPRREHVVIGETESGKTWLALGCVAAELTEGNRVVYIHSEESDPSSTIERLRLLGITDDAITQQLRFVAPTRAVLPKWLTPLLEPAPALVIHDGVNEAMALHGAEIKAAEGASLFRRWLIQPCLRAGAATLACDHMPMGADGSRRDAYGSVHKGNAIDGARILLENTAPFGRSMRGASYVFVTKDRPGQLRAHGKPSKTAGKTFMGTLVVDDTQAFEPFSVQFYAPRSDEETPNADPGAELAGTVYDVITARPDRTVGSMRLLMAELRKADQGIRFDAVRDAVDDLVVSGRAVEVPGKRNATGYRAVPTVSQDSSDETVSGTVSATVSLLERETRQTVADSPVPTVSETVGNGGKQSGPVTEGKSL